MHTPPLETDERAFQMNAHGLGPPSARVRVTLSVLNRGSQTIQGGEDVITGRCHRGWQVAGDSVLREQCLSCGQSPGILFHYIVAGPAVNMDVHVPRRKNRISEVDLLRTLR